MLRVCTSSTESALLGLDAYKASAKIATTSDDTVIQYALDRATSLIEGYLGYPLKRQVYQETVPSGGSNYLQVSRTPLQAVQSVTYQDTDVVDPTSYDIDSPGAGILYRPLGWPWSAGLTWDLAPHVAPNSELRDFTVVYEAGYCVNGSTDAGWLTTGEPVPGEIEAAIQQAASFIYLSAGRDPSITSQKIGDLSFSYMSGGSMTGGQTQIGGLPESVKGMLAHLRRF